MAEQSSNDFQAPLVADEPAEVLLEELSLPDSSVDFDSVPLEEHVANNARILKMALPQGDMGPVSMDILKKFAPEVRLHPTEDYFPSSVEYYLQNGQIKDKGGKVLVNAPSFADLEKYGGGEKEDRFLTLINDFEDDHRFGPKPVNGLIEDAPMYVRAYTKGNSVWLDYVFFYPYNGAQNFKFKYNTSPFHYHYRSGRERDLAEHLGDWEHIEVEVSKDFSKVLSLLYFGHGDPTVIKPQPSQFVDGTHPIVYSARDSHASYPAPAPTGLKLAGPYPSWMMAVKTKEMQVADISADGGAKWQPWKNKSGLVQFGVDGHGKAKKEFHQQWVDWRHRWGASRQLGMGQMHLFRADSNDVSNGTCHALQHFFKAVMLGSIVFSGIKDLQKLRDGRGVSPPNWWYDGY